MSFTNHVKNTVAKATKRLNILRARSRSSGECMQRNIYCTPRMSGQLLNTPEEHENHATQGCTINTGCLPWTLNGLEEKCKWSNSNLTHTKDRLLAVIRPNEKFLGFPNNSNVNQQQQNHREETKERSLQETAKSMVKTSVDSNIEKTLLLISSLPPWMDDFCNNIFLQLNLQNIYIL